MSNQFTTASFFIVSIQRLLILSLEAISLQQELQTTDFTFQTFLFAILFSDVLLLFLNLKNIQKL